MYIIDDLLNDKALLPNGRWVLARPLNYQHRSLRARIKDAWAVFTGKADAVTWIEQ